MRSLGHEASILWLTVDLVLHCQGARSNQRSIQIWLNKGVNGYTLSKSYDLPKGSGPISFADMGELIIPKWGPQVNARP